MGKEKKNKDITLPFIKTSDEETMTALKAEGFNLVDFNNGIWTFANCTSKTKCFNEDINSKIAFSNMLCF